MLHKLTATATAGIEKTRIKSSELKLGMYVAELDRSWLDSPFLVQGFVIHNNKQLAQLRELCSYVYIDITRGNFARPNGYAHKPKNLTEHPITAEFIENLARAKVIHGKTKAVVEDMFNAFRSGEMFIVDDIKSTIAECVDNIIANPDSMAWLSMIKHKDEYTVEHSLNVALLSIALGRAEGLDKQQLKTLGECAALHDVGKVKIPDEILNKEGNLNAEEFAVMKMHTVHGKKLLLNQPQITDMAVEIALSHHERLDGSGYPGGLTAEQIPYMVKIVSIADAYDAMTSGRIYCEAKPATEALKLLLKGKDQHVDGDLLNRFIECIGVYPIGSVVELNSGEAGVVLPSNMSEQQDKLMPSVLLVSDSNRQQCSPRKIRIGTDRFGDKNKPYMIRAIYPDGKHGIQLQDYADIAIEFIAS